MPKGTKSTPENPVVEAQAEAEGMNERLMQAQSENPSAARVAVEHMGDIQIIRVDQ